MNDNVKLVENQNERNSRIKIIETKVLEQAETLERKLELLHSRDECNITNVKLSELKTHNETYALLISRLMCTNCSQRFKK